MQFFSDTYRHICDKIKKKQQKKQKKKGFVQGNQWHQRERKRPRGASIDFNIQFSQDDNLTQILEAIGNKEREEAAAEQQRQKEKEEREREKKRQNTRQTNNNNKFRNFWLYFWVYFWLYFCQVTCVTKKKKNKAMTVPMLDLQFMDTHRRHLNSDNDII